VFDLSLAKLLVLAAIALVIFGPSELPKIASQAGRALRDLRKIAESAKNDLREGLGPEYADFEIEDLNPKRFVHKQLLGDLNADGAQGNDLIYIPSDVAKDAEIRFSGISAVAGADNSPAAQNQRIAEQRSALERFITSTDCLTRQRGRIMTRNSCRSPWTNTVNVSIRQSLPSVLGQAFAVQLDVFNFMNLLNSDWGQQPLPPAGGGSVALLNHVGQTAGSLSGANGSQGVFTFDPATEKYDRRHVGSVYQMQLGVRYGF